MTRRRKPPWFESWVDRLFLALSLGCLLGAVLLFGCDNRGSRWTAHCGETGHHEVLDGETVQCTATGKWGRYQGTLVPPKEPTPWLAPVIRRQ